ncbi:MULTISPECIES: RICIN domain-containing protein [unclassified Streptomyces]|uniref:RICIN domain-containing protein n=1 Tax=unclassified Streptomyces TaxID=2593676 RepID=UPI003811FCDF
MGMGEEQRPSSLIEVVIAADGSAVVDGEPVPVVGGESVDVAILDTLHGYARSRNEAVRAAISDPDSDYVAIVEVAPDGSSRMLEQQDGSGAPGEASAEDSEPTALTAVPVPVEPLGEQPLSLAKDTGADIPAESAEPGAPGAPAGFGARDEPVVSSGANGGSGRPRFPRGGQSDDEYEGPGLLKRPAVIGAVGVVVALAVVVPLIVLGSQTEGTSKDRAATTVEGQDPSPTYPTTVPSFTWSTTSPSPSLSPSPSASPSASASASKSASPSPTPKRTKAPVEPNPRKTAKDPDDVVVPAGAVLLKNKKWTTCLDLPGTGKGKINLRVQDGPCIRSDTDNQRWTLRKSSSGKGTRGADLYLIRNEKDGLCLDLPSYGGAKATTPVTEFNCDGTDHDNQLWWFDQRANGTYWIRNQKSGDLCLDVSRVDNKPENAGITIYGCSDLDDHQWTFVKD